MGFGVWGLEYRVQGLGVSGLGVLRSAEPEDTLDPRAFQQTVNHNRLLPLILSLSLWRYWFTSCSVVFWAVCVMMLCLLLQPVAIIAFVFFLQSFYVSATNIVSLGIRS